MSSQIDAIAAVLARWKGTDARIESYTASLHMLRITLTRPEQKDEVLKISIADTQRIESPTSWKNASLVPGATYTDEFGAEILGLCDERADAHFHGAVIEISEGTKYFRWG
jgi:hypothetical protein